MSDVHITIADIRVLYCVKGAKKIFDEVEAKGGPSFANFLRQGAKASELRGHGYDALIDRIVASKAERGDGL